MSNCIRCASLLTNNSFQCEICNYSIAKHPVLTLFPLNYKQLHFYKNDIFKSMSTEELYVLAHDNDPNAQYEIAYRNYFQSSGISNQVFIENSKSLAQTYSDAFYWFSRSADLGNANAMYELAGIYSGKTTSQQICLKSLGREKDDDKALLLYIQSASKGNVAAMYKAGNYFYEKYNSANNESYTERLNNADLQNALLWYEKASSYGHNPSNEMLKNIYTLEVVEMLHHHNSEAAKSWLQDAIKRGSKVAFDIMEKFKELFDLPIKS